MFFHNTYTFAVASAHNLEERNHGVLSGISFLNNSLDLQSCLTIKLSGLRSSY